MENAFKKIFLSFVVLISSPSFVQAELWPFACVKNYRSDVVGFKFTFCDRNNPKNCSSWDHRALSPKTASGPEIMHIVTRTNGKNKKNYILKIKEDGGSKIYTLSTIKLPSQNFWSNNDFVNKNLQECNGGNHVGAFVKNGGFKKIRKK